MASHLEFRSAQKSQYSVRISLLSISLLSIGLSRHARAARPMLGAGAGCNPPREPNPQPQVKVNMLNVCSPSAEEQKEIAAALARVPKQPLFGTDFEVSRGRSTLTDMPNFCSPEQVRTLPTRSPWRVMFAFAANFPCRHFFPACSIPSAMTGRTWWRRWCCTCAIPRI